MVIFHRYVNVYQRGNGDRLDCGDDEHSETRESLFCWLVDISHSNLALVPSHHSEVSWNRATPWYPLIILLFIGFSMVNKPTILDTPICGNPQRSHVFFVGKPSILGDLHFTKPPLKVRAVHGIWGDDRPTPQTPRGCFGSKKVQGGRVQEGWLLWLMRGIPL